jgi:hypothetical protein
MQKYLFLLCALHAPIVYSAENSLVRILEKTGHEIFTEFSIGALQGVAFSCAQQSADEAINDITSNKTAIKTFNTVSLPICAEFALETGSLIERYANILGINATSEQPLFSRSFLALPQTKKAHVALAKLLRLGGFIVAAGYTYSLIQESKRSNAIYE